MTNVPHEYGPSRVGHGEAQCIHCHGTNRENAVISPNHCDARAEKICGMAMGAASCDKPKDHDGPHEFVEDFL